MECEEGSKAIWTSKEGMWKLGEGTSEEVAESPMPVKPSSKDDGIWQ